jgi:predicted metal-binding membrane protein
MAMLVVLGLTSLIWMIATAVMVIAQKLLPATVAIDAPLALAIIALGLLILVAPTAIPGLTPPM